MTSPTIVSPPPGRDWRQDDPADLGFVPTKLAEAVELAQSHEVPWSRDIAEQLAKGQFEPPPWNEILGPTSPRGGPQGVIARHGRIAATWGDPDRADMTFSVAKSYLAVLAGIAVMEGLIQDVDHPVADYVRDGGFAGAQNEAVTWRHLLQQTSEWSGTVWDKPDVVDHNRQLGAGADNSRKGTPRTLQAPGSFWEYNDVRVNRLSLALMEVFRRPLPDVLAEFIMAPLGCSGDWSWRGYRNAWHEIDGVRMQGVPGGSHWGGGIWIGARDQARLGQLILQRGRWGDRQLLPADWIAEMLTPCAQYDEYGFLWWLNTGRRRWPAASAEAHAAIGAGGNLVLVEPGHDLVVVARWLDDRAVNEVLAQIFDAIDD